MAWVPIVKTPGENPTQRQVLNCRLDEEKMVCVGTVCKEIIVRKRQVYWYN